LIAFNLSLLLSVSSSNIEPISLRIVVIDRDAIAFSHFLGNEAGQIFVFFILTVAAAEVAIGLAILKIL
jgi:NADH-quinone oxidoreductase subunit K